MSASSIITLAAVAGGSYLLYNALSSSSTIPNPEGYAVYQQYQKDHPVYVANLATAYARSNGTKEDYAKKFDDVQTEQSKRLQALAWSRSEPYSQSDYGLKLKEVYDETFGKGMW
jgi:hypothetical protein